jgi:hypothetical protein
MGMLSESSDFRENPADFLAEWSWVTRQDFSTG